MNTNMCNYKVGDYIYKTKNNKIETDLKLYKILSIKEERGGNWHDGFSINYIATILSQDSTTDYSTEEYLIQYKNPMCQINLMYGVVVKDEYIYT
jgi:hypothetical protein